MVGFLGVILAIIIVSYMIEKKLNIPLTLSLLTLSFGIKLIFQNAILIDNKELDELILLLLPIVLLPDILSIHIQDVKKNWKPIFYFSVISVVVTMILGAYIAKTFIFGPTITIAAAIALFAILSATDAVSVLNVFSKFELPHKLKTIAEGDSLANDPVAIILFKLIGISLILGMDIGTQTVVNAASIFGVSIITGIGIGFVSHIILKYLDDKEFELLVIYAAAVISFIAAEHFHASGILSVIISVSALKLLIEADIERAEDRIDTLTKTGLHNEWISSIKNKIAVSKDHMDENQKVTNFIALIGNSCIFIFMAFSIDLNILTKYLYEILAVFGLLLAIRAILSVIAVKIMKKPQSWAVILTMAGIKGGLSLIMVHSLPNFELKEMLTAIVVGNVLLSTYLNTVMLMIYLKTKPRLVNSI